MLDPCLVFFAALVAREPHTLQDLTASSHTLEANTKTDAIELLCEALAKSDKDDGLANVDVPKARKAANKPETRLVCAILSLLI